MPNFQEKSVSFGKISLNVPLILHLMEIYEHTTDLKTKLQQARQNGKRVGFVPTMGALHQGHISLIEEARKHCDIVVCSIFVNPTQFNDAKDLDRYPRTPESDCRMLEAAGCDVVFLPSVIEIYPEKDTRKFDFGRLEELLEGKHRPGHFNGVAQVVSRLFDSVMPDMAFFGQKDYQQVMIVKALVKQLKLNIEIVACAIVREPDGLAMSSRNVLLSAEERKVASAIPIYMDKAKAMAEKGITISEIKKGILEMISNEVLMKLDYFEFCNNETLESLNENESIEKGKSIVLIAVYVGKIRLIDNVLL